MTLPTLPPFPDDIDPAAGAAPLVARLVSHHGARWIGRGQIDALCAEAGNQVLFFHGDPVRFPEVLDVAVVLPELQKAYPGRLRVGVVTRADEDALATRFAANRWPSLLFLRDGGYVTLIPGMLDWDDYVVRVGQALALPARRTPGVGIAVVAEGASGAAAPSCH
ncbi:MAG: hydrogenase expression/formation protein HupG [Pseudomonadota bacterium]|jgi:hydrogenase-1 operon protein HyaE